MDMIFCLLAVFGPVYGFDVNKDNILVIGWNNQVDTGYVSGVAPIYKQSGPVLCFHRMC
jgi:hypothetical protein